MQLRDRRGRINEPAHNLDLVCEIADVFFRTAVVLGDDLVAGAVIADGVAERYVQVQRQRLHCRAGCSREQRVDELLGGEPLGETVGGGIRGIARAEPVVLLHQGGVEDELGCGGVGHGSFR